MKRDLYNPNSQEVDSTPLTDGNGYLRGRGQEGGGSKPTPQVSRMHKGSAHIPSSAPRRPQKLRG